MYRKPSSCQNLSISRGVAYIYTYIYIYIYIYTYIYIYIYTYIYIMQCTNIYIYIYIYIFAWRCGGVLRLRRRGAGGEGPAGRGEGGGGEAQDQLEPLQGGASAKSTFCEHFATFCPICFDGLAPEWLNWWRTKTTCLRDFVTLSLTGYPLNPGGQSRLRWRRCFFWITP